MSRKKIILDTTSKSGYKVLQKSVFKFTNGAPNFLNNLTANEMDKPQNAFLDRFGKLVALADQKVIGDDVYIVIEKQYEGKFLEHINNYLRFSKTKIEKLDLKAVHIIDSKNRAINQSAAINHFKNNIMLNKNIGYIALLKNDELNLLNNLNEIPDDVYEILRIENNIPIQGIDFENNMFLETGVDAVSFTKGCYLGQEIIARTSNLGRPARKLVRILYDRIPENNIVTINGKEAGKITSKCFSPKYNKFLAFAMIRDYEKELDNGKILK